MVMTDTGGCREAMELLNMVFSARIILNDGHEIFARLEAGDDVADIADDLSEKLGDKEMAGPIRGVIERWPRLHVEAVGQLLHWALAKLDTEDRVMIQWKGDDESPETVTKFELRDHTLLIEFAHPPGSLEAAQAGA
jgi:hypothetical protein